MVRRAQRRCEEREDEGCVASSSLSEIDSGQCDEGVTEEDHDLSTVPSLSMMLSASNNTTGPVYLLNRSNDVRCTTYLKSGSCGVRRRRMTRARYDVKWVRVWGSVAWLLKLKLPRDSASAKP
jgi:hypothetical protein